MSISKFTLERLCTAWPRHDAVGTFPCIAMRRQRGRLTVFPGRPRLEPRVVRSAGPGRYGGLLQYSTTSPASQSFDISGNRETGVPESSRGFSNGVVGRKTHFDGDPEVGERTPKPQLDTSGLLRDVFNYAAHFGLVPQLSAPIKCEGTGEFKITIALAEQGIEVEGVGRTRKPATQKAAIAFKQAVERYCREDPEALRVLETPSLTTSTSALFLAFYKNVHGLPEEVEIRYKTVYANSGAASAQAYLHGEELGVQVFHPRESDAKLLAGLSAAVTLRKHEPELWPKFLEQLSVRGDLTLFPIDSVSLNLKGSTLTDLQDATHSLKNPAPTHNGRHPPVGQVPKDAVDSETTAPQRDLDAREKQLKDFRQKYWNDRRLEPMRNATRALPIYDHLIDVVPLIDNNKVCVIAGPTGTGKTTQVPQIILNSAIARSEGTSCNILMTQSYTNTAKALSQRVAHERGERLGPTVTHHVQLAAPRPVQPGNISISSTEIVLKRLQIDADGLLGTHSHIIIDELDTRDVHLDALISALKHLMMKRKQRGVANPTLILMGSTVDISHLTRYLGDLSSPDTGGACPSFCIPSQTYPVKVNFLEDLFDELSSFHEDALLQRLYQEKQTSLFLSKQAHQADSPATSEPKAISGTALNWDKMELPLQPITGNRKPQVHSDNNIPIGLIVAAIAHISKTKPDDGPILVFLPDTYSILKVQKMLLSSMPLGVDFADENRYRIMQLFSALELNDSVFDSLSVGCRKIILSGAITETSIPIPDIRYVIDAGRCFPFESDPENTCRWIDKACVQRRLETAAKNPGGAYYALFSSQKHESLLPVTTPALHQRNIQDVCLAAGLLAPDTGVPDFFANSIDPPRRTHVENSVSRLQKVGALDEQEGLTPLGRALATLPLPPAMGKAVVLGTIFRCLDPMILLSQQDVGHRIFKSPVTRADFPKLHQTRALFTSVPGSYHSSLVNAFKHMQSNPDGNEDTGPRGFLNYSGYEQLSRKINRIKYQISQMGLIEKGRGDEPVVERTANANSNDMEVIRAVLIPCLAPNIARKTSSSAFWRTRESNSLVSLNTSFIPQVDDLLVIYSFVLDSLQNPAAASDKAQRNITLVENTYVNPLMACLLGGKIEGNDRSLTMDKWLSFEVRTGKGAGEDNRIVNSILEFNESFNKVLSLAFERFAELGRQNLSGSTPQVNAHDDPLFSHLSGTLIQSLRRAIGPDPRAPDAKSPMRRIPIRKLS